MVVEPSESLSIEDAFGNKFMEVVDLIKPEDITEKCWTGYTKKKGMKTMFGKKMVPNCVRAEEVQVDEAVRLPAEYGNLDRSCYHEEMQVSPD